MNSILRLPDVTLGQADIEEAQREKQRLEVWKPRDMSDAVTSDYLKHVDPIIFGWFSTDLLSASAGCVKTSSGKVQDTSKMKAAAT